MTSISNSIFKYWRPYRNPQRPVSSNGDVPTISKYGCNFSGLTNLTNLRFPLSTNLLSTNIAGPGTTALFRASVGVGGNWWNIWCLWRYLPFPSWKITLSERKLVLEGRRVVFWCMIFVESLWRVLVNLKEMQVQMVDTFLEGNLSRWIILVEAV